MKLIPLGTKLVRRKSAKRGPEHVDVGLTKEGKPFSTRHGPKESKPISYELKAKLKLLYWKFQYIRSVMPTNFYMNVYFFKSLFYFFVVNKCKIVALDHRMLVPIPNLSY